MLAEEMHVPLPCVAAFRNEQGDPFVCGTDKHVAGARWFASLWKRFEFPDGVHLRRIHYVLVSAEAPVLTADGERYLNTKEHWIAMCEASRWARHTDLVDPSSFHDARNPPPHLLADTTPSLDAIEGPRWTMAEAEEDSPWYLPEVYHTLRCRRFELPQPVVAGYDYSPGDQDYHLEVWAEKSTMNDVLIPVCRDMNAHLVTGVGFMSITTTIKLLQRIDSLPRHRPTRIIYISDFDPAGEDMPTSVARQIEFYMDKFCPGREIKLNPLVLTREQVVEYRLPRIPIKESDLRRARFEDRHGEGAVELDALEALQPGRLGRLVTEALEPYRDEDLQASLEETHDEAQELADEAWTESTRELQERLRSISEKANQIAAPYRKKLEMLRRRLAKEMQPLQRQLDEARHDLDQTVDTFSVELPERPEPEIDLPDEAGWLFDSGRDYLDQLKHYQARKGGDGLEQRQRICKTCGAEFMALRVKAEYCSKQCSQAGCYSKRKAKRKAERAGRCPKGRRDSRSCPVGEGRALP
jgi:hypothetical protein